MRQKFEPAIPRQVFDVPEGCVSLEVCPDSLGHALYAHMPDGTRRHVAHTPDLNALHAGVRWVAAFRQIPILQGEDESF